MIDSFIPQSMHRPKNVAELADLIRRASADGMALYSFGGATMQHLGYTPTKPGLGIDMRNFCEVIDYPAHDMTITVQAGTTIAKLQEMLAKENQRLPIDVPQPDVATLGGAIAVNASGPRRYGFGTLRDYVIGISYMNDEGQEVKAGGRVVKNVAGYDLCKLQIGALGTLGIITQVTLKVKPKPEAAALVFGGCRTNELESLLDRIHSSSTRPNCIEIVDHGPLKNVDFGFHIGYEDSRAAVEWQLKCICRELQPEFPALERTDSGAERDLKLLTDDASAKSEIAFKANMQPSATAGFLRQIKDLPPMLFQAHAGNGIIIGGWLENLGRTKQAFAQLRQFAVQNHGNLIITRCPAEWKRELPIWGEPRGDWALMKKVKQAIDPKNLFNPGRFISG